MSQWKPAAGEFIEIPPDWTVTIRFYPTGTAQIIGWVGPVPSKAKEEEPGSGIAEPDTTKLYRLKASKRKFKVVTKTPDLVEIKFLGEDIVIGISLNDFNTNAVEV
jgi:hypothetical protein